MTSGASETFRQYAGLVVGTLLLVATSTEAQHQYSAEDGSPSLMVFGFVHADFADVDLPHEPIAKHAGDANAEEDGFREARLALHLSASLSPTWSAFAEVEFSVFDDSSRESVERFFVKYSHSDKLKLSVGRFHSPLGWWNNHFHHGRWLQTSIDRPLLWEFGSTFQPGHYWGVQADGRMPMGPMEISYSLGSGAGRAESIFSPEFNYPIDADRSYFFNLGFSPQSNSNLNFGVSWWGEDLELIGRDDVEETMTTVYFATRGEQPEVLTEWVRVEHDFGAAGGEIDHDAYYLQLGYRLNQHEGQFKPYLRIEEVDLDPLDPIYAGLEGGASRSVVGLRYDFHPKVAWKFEFRRDDPDIGGSFNVLQTQIALVF